MQNILHRQSIRIGIKKGKDDDSQISESRSSEMPDSGFFFSYMSMVTLTMWILLNKGAASAIDYPEKTK